MNRIFYLIWIIPAYAVMYCLLPGEVDWHAGEAWCGTASPSQGSFVWYTGVETGGGKLFQDNCARCHNQILTKESTGPALLGVHKRIPGGDWRYRYIRNADSMLAAGDEYAVAVDKRYPDAVMDPMPHLSYRDIDAIMGYLEAMSQAYQP